MNNKSKEIQSLHGSLNDARITKERLEQKVVELMEMSHNMPNDSLEARIQVGGGGKKNSLFLALFLVRSHFPPLHRSS